MDNDKTIDFSQYKDKRRKTKKPLKVGKKSKKKQVKNDVFVTTDRFEWANDKIKEDMNKAFSMAATGINSFNILIDYLINKKVIDPEDFNNYIKKIQKSLKDPK